MGVPYRQAQLAEKTYTRCQSHFLCRLPMVAISYAVRKKSRAKFTNSRTESSILHNRNNNNNNNNNKGRARSKVKSEVFLKVQVL